MWRALRWWWRQPDHYDWFIAYLRRRSMAPVTRGVIAFAAFFLGAIPVGMLFGAAAPPDLAQRALTVLAAAIGVVCGLVWTMAFPTRRQSIAFAMAANVSIGAVALAQTDPFLGLLSCTAFVTVGAYIALFHTAGFMLISLAVILAVPAAVAVRIADASGVVVALSGFGVVLAVNVIVPFGIQILVHSLGVDVARAARDPLTGLLNRRSFFERASRQINSAGAGTAFSVIMIDLDRFKALNDTQGHAIGDQALVAVAAALTEVAGDGALVARVGGEEFLIAHLDGHPASAEVVGQGLREAVEGLPHPITASIGTAGARCVELRAHGDTLAALRSVVELADLAMYEAKRDGGNQVRHHVDPQLEPL